MPPLGESAVISILPKRFNEFWPNPACRMEIRHLGGLEGNEGHMQLINSVRNNEQKELCKNKIPCKRKRNSDGGIRTPVSAVKERSDNPYTTSEIYTILSDRGILIPTFYCHYCL